MPNSVKRQAIIVDEYNPLADILPPPLTSSPSPSIESVDGFVPSTPNQSNMDRDAFLLPGFHFCTSDESADPAEFHRIAAQLLSGEVHVDVDEKNEAVRTSQSSSHLHCDLGKDLSGRHCCSCGKSYPTGHGLMGHIRRCAGVNNYPCHTCDQVFTSPEQLNRHVTLRHNGDKEPCPECGAMFPSAELPRHLATGLGGCDGTLQSDLATHLELLDKEACARRTISERYWVIDGDHSWEKRGTHDSGYAGDDDEDIATQTMSFVTRLLQKPVSSPDTIACDLCGEEFRAEGNALAEHIGQHSLDFSEKRHRCDDCRVFFANEKDLNRHLQAANLTHHCGFTFRHNGDCTGHHPPIYTKSSVTSDHALMQKHLWSWELSQFRAHRVAVATILAETLNGTAEPHMSLADCKSTYASLLPHFAAAADAYSAQPRWSATERDSLDVASLDKHFSRVIDDIEAQRALTAAQLEFNSSQELSDRPDSGVIMQATRVSFYKHRRADPHESKPCPAVVVTTSAPAKPSRPPSHSRSSSFRKSLLGLTSKRAGVDDPAAAALTAMKKVGGSHKRAAMSASGSALFWQRADLSDRPSSAPISAARMTAAC